MRTLVNEEEEEDEWKWLSEICSYKKETDEKEREMSEREKEMKYCQPEVELKWLKTRLPTKSETKSEFKVIWHFRCGSRLQTGSKQKTNYKVAA